MPSQRPFVRLVLAISLDGRLAPPEGGPAQLGGAGDRIELERAMVWADACLLGAGTLQAHQCTCLIREPALLQQRLDDGRPPQPPALVVSHRSAFPVHWPFFQQPLERWLLAPVPATEGFDRWFPLQTTWTDRLGLLASAGVQNLLLLGGARLASDLLREDCVDELQLTLVPTLLGGEHSWLPAGMAPLPNGLAAAGAWRQQEARPLGDGDLLLRYRRWRG